jgi:hypothetical protein
MYSFFEVSGHYLESLPDLRVLYEFLNHIKGGMVFYQVFFRTEETVRGCVSLKKSKSQGGRLLYDFIQEFGLWLNIRESIKKQIKNTILDSSISSVNSVRVCATYIN